MKKILLAIGFFIALTTEAQVVNKFRDSSVFFKGVRFDSTLVFKGLKSGSTADTNVVVISSTGNASKVSKSAFLGDLPIYSISDSNAVINYDVLNSQNAPPGSPATGDTYLVGTSPTGAWVGHAKDIAEWNGSAWVFTDGVQGDFLYNATNALTYIFRSGNWVQTTGIPALNNGNTISSGLIIGTNNARSLTFETNNVNRGRFDSIGRFHIYNLPTSSTSDTFVTKSDLSGKLTKVGQSTFLSGVGGASLSGLTSATATNIINNGNFQQEWQWNSLTSGVGLKLSSSSTGAASNTQTIFSVSQTGANATPQTTYAADFSNTKTGASSTNIALYSTASGGTLNTSILADNTSASATDYTVKIKNNYSGGSTPMMNILAPNLTGTNKLFTSFGKDNTNNFETSYTYISSGNSLNYYSLTGAGQLAGTGLNITTAGKVGIGITNPSAALDVISPSGGAGTGIRLYQAVNNATASISYASIDFQVPSGINGQFFTTASNYFNSSINLASNSIGLASHGTQLFLGSSGYMTFNAGGLTTTDEAMRITSSKNIGIGTSTPSASAILDLTSTTKGFLPPRMTATQASAISSPAQGLLLFVSDTNGTFTSVGWWGYNGSTWEKLNN
mgnify:CR=1 FL=1